MSAHDLRFPRNADRWCGAVVLLVLALSCAVEKKMPEAQAAKPGGRVLQPGTWYVGSDSIIHAKPCDCAGDFQKRAKMAGEYVRQALGRDSTSFIVVPGYIVAVRRHMRGPSDTVRVQVDL